MSPIPPPAGAFVPSDDWTEDPSFDLSPSAHHLALPASPSSSSTASSTSHRSHSSISNTRQHTQSPLRQLYTGLGKGTIKLKKREDIEELLGFDNDDDDFDLPEGDLPLQSKVPIHHHSNRPRSSTSSSTSSSITRTIIGNGSTGIGTITKLGSTPKPPIMQGTVKARALALEKSWEADVDFDDIPTTNNMPTTKSEPQILKLNKYIDKSSSIKRLTLSPPTRKGFIMPSADALDDLGFDLDQDEEDQATLKAGATIKAMLPPPRQRNPSTIKSSSSSSKLNNIPPPKRPSTPPNQDQDNIELESDFALPLNLTNLTLATQAPRESRRKSNKPRSSNASTATNTESWDSPNSNHKKSWGWGSEDSPGGSSNLHKRRSETSATSISDALPETPNDSDRNSKFKKQILIEPDQNDLDLEEDDMENGLVLPSPTFFSNQRSKELNSILDKKRKPQFAPLPNQQNQLNNVRGATIDDSFKQSGKHRDDSFEDGLVLDEPGVELSKHRLKEKKRARDKFPSSSTSTIKSRGNGSSNLISGTTKSVAKEREKAWDKQREQGRGRITPLPTTTTAANNQGVRERTQSSLGLSSFRSNSASATTSHLKEDNKRVDSPTLTGREKESMRSRSGHLHTMLPPPIPSSSSSHASSSTLTAGNQVQAPISTPSSRLRHQKSHFHLGGSGSITQQSPSLNRKQSLASLQDALADRSSSMTPSTDNVSTPRYHNSTSRLTMPTSSSKAKTRPPIHSIFPTHTPQSSASSASFTNPSSSSKYSYNAHEGVKRMVDMPRRNKNWGDGSELDGIDDLSIDDDQHKSTIKGNSMGSIGLGKSGRRGHEPSQPQRGTPTPKPVPIEEKRKKSGTITTNAKRKNRKPALIKHFGVADKKKVVGEMTWNPTTLRWEGNESILRDFDTISVSARPALITHYTGSSVGVGGLSSPVGNAPTAPRIVGDMQFDPVNMKWVSILSPEDDEPDPFEGMADDEDDEFGLGSGCTITRSSGRRLVNIGDKFSKIQGTFSIGGASSDWTSRLVSESSIISNITANTNTTTNTTKSSNFPSSSSFEDKLQMQNNLISEELWKECKQAEERHKKELKGWILRQTSNSFELRERERKEEKRLWEIRNLAMKS
ncbi:uncharacterized protein L201_003152 [Kwoniella dendrophila CBS 6074]|uniref:Cytokinesis regulator n=1 Tax=Kwoniella dendrophila CBS 6074 TaxID=1295534 RepID=A0AAX4JS06_9TREE